MLVPVRTFYRFSCFLVCLVFGSCSEEPVQEDKKPVADPIVGKWGNAKFSVMFIDDGNFTSREEHSQVDKGTWSRTDDGKIRVLPEDGDVNKAEVFEARIDGNNLTLSADRSNGELWAIVLERDHPGPPKLEAERPPQPNAKEIRAKADLKNIETQIQSYNIRNRMYPTTEQGLKALIEKPSLPPVPKRWVQLLQDDLDPWGRPYSYRYPAERGEVFELWSLGPDGKSGTFDDIVNWDK